MSGARRVWIASALAGLLASFAWADEPVEAQSLAELSLEQLAEIPITTVTREEETLGRTAASVSVLTAEELTRAPIYGIPDALRLVPGVQVAQIGSHKWAISARGFSGQFANKLLVLIDGRSVYTPLYSGVYWAAHDPLLEDVDRIEVVRGPGGTLWGANAVNGVINVVSKSAADTQGLLVSALGGIEPVAGGALRYGGGWGDALHYRLYLRHAEHAPARLEAGDEAEDSWRLTSAGLRVDWRLTDKATLALTADGHTGHRREHIDGLTIATPPYSTVYRGRAPSKAVAATLRYRQDLGRAGRLSASAWFDRSVEGVIQIEDRRTTADVEVLHVLPVVEGLHLALGGGHRFSRDQVEGDFAASFVPAARTLRLWSGLLDARARLFDEKLNVSAGARAEHNDYTGWELQPSARVHWQAHQRHGIWAAVTRAVRTPSRLDVEGRNNTAVLPAMVAGGRPTVLQTRGNPNLAVERLLAAEVGWRVLPVHAVTADVSLFHHGYDDLIAYRPLPLDTTSLAPQFDVQPRGSDNILRAHSWGGELSVQWQLTRWQQLIAGYALLDLTFESEVPDVVQRLSGRDPQHQAIARSRTDLGERWELDLVARFVDELPGLMVPHYFELDARVGWRWGGLRIEAIGRNLLRNDHPEFRSNPQMPPLDARRELFARATFTY